MRKRSILLLAMWCLTGALLAAQNAPSKVEPALSAAPEGRMNSPWWAARHTKVLEKIKSTPDTRLLMIGDSITNNYDKSQPPDEDFAPIWQKYYAPRKALNLGFSGDTTAHLLWRLQHGELDGVHPKAAVVLIGTNDTDRALGKGVKAEVAIAQTEAGIDAVVAELRKRLPETKVLLLGILPTAITPEKSAVDKAVNAYLKVKFKHDARVTFLDLASTFYTNGKLNEKMFYDPRLSPPRGALHPDTVGQRKMAEAIEPVLARLLGEASIKADSGR